MRWRQFDFNKANREMTDYQHIIKRNGICLYTLKNNNMSFVISIYVKEGIVLASDSRTTFSAVQTIQPQKEGETPSVVNHLGVSISRTQITRLL